MFDHKRRTVRWHTAVSQLQSYARSTSHELLSDNCLIHNIKRRNEDGKIMLVQRRYTFWQLSNCTVDVYMFTNHIKRIM